MEVITASNAFNVRWNNHHRTFMNVLERVFEDETYADCSLAAEGREISTHKLILSACSPFLSSVLQKHRDKHPIVVLRDVTFLDLKLVLEYIYKGEVSVSQENLTSFLKTAEMLQVTGLQEVLQENCETPSDTVIQTPKKKRKRNSKPDDEELSNCSVEFLTDELDHKGDILFVVDDFASPEEPIDDKIRNELEGFLESTVPTASPIQTETDENEEKKPGTRAKVQLKRCKIMKNEEYNICCGVCKGIYKNENSFVNHQRYDCNMIHTCEKCLKTFKNRRHLLDHTRDDCGRVHVCRFCKRVFKQKVNLTTHQKHYCKRTDTLLAAKQLSTDDEFE